eukprot:1157247-Pelagomonas_calceolata.AAC.2
MPQPQGVEQAGPAGSLGSGAAERGSTAECTGLLCIVLRRILSSIFPALFAVPAGAALREGPSPAAAAPSPNCVTRAAEPSLRNLFFLLCSYCVKQPPRQEQRRGGYGQL